MQYSSSKFEDSIFMVDVCVRPKSAYLRECVVTMGTLGFIIRLDRSAHTAAHMLGGVWATDTEETRQTENRDYVDVVWRRGRWSVMVVFDDVAEKIRSG